MQDRVGCTGQGGWMYRTGELDVQGSGYKGRGVRRAAHPPSPVYVWPPLPVCLHPKLLMYDVCLKTWTILPTKNRYDDSDSDDDLGGTPQQFMGTV